MKEAIQQELKLLLEQLPLFTTKYGENDIRTSFFDGYFQILRTFYCAYFQLESDDIIQKYNEIYNRKDITREQVDTLIQGHKNLLNSFMIINTWSNFEYCLVLISDAVLPANLKKNLLAFEYDKVLKMLKGINIPDVQNKKLMKLNKPHLTHVPMPLKYGKIFKIITTYPTERSIEADRNFLDFFGKLRNCIHSNYVFLGQDNSEYEFKGVNYKFISGKLLYTEPIIEENIFNLSQELKQVFISIIEGFDYDGIIFDESINLLN